MSVQLFKKKIEIVCTRSLNNNNNNDQQGWQGFARRLLDLFRRIIRESHSGNVCEALHMERRERKDPNHQTSSL